MRRIFPISVILPLLLACVLCGDAFAKGGRGGGGPKHGGFKGGGGQGGNVQRGGAGQFRHSHKSVGRKQVGGHKHSSLKSSARTGNSWSQARKQQIGQPLPQGTADGHHPRDMQRLNEDRKLAHRRSIAEHLREVGDRNGNTNLHDVADRMERKAEEHYQKRLAKIDPQAGDEPLPDDGVDSLPDGELIEPEPESGLPPGDVADDLPEDWTDEIGRLTGRENALYRQLRNEERKLAHRMEAVERLRELADLNGDSELLAAAARLEESALGHYEQRMAKIAEFRDRFGLPDLSGMFPAPIAPQ